MALDPRDCGLSEWGMPLPNPSGFLGYPDVPQDSDDESPKPCTDPTPPKAPYAKRYVRRVPINETETNVSARRRLFV